ncbi:MAG: PqqD family protein [Candidatus Omnitrophota bacterium]
MERKDAYRINKDKIACRVIEGEAVLLNVDKGTYYCLNKTGTLIWECLAEGKNVAQVLQMLCTRFKSIAQKTLEKDLHELLRDLGKEEIVCRKQ